MDAGDGPCSSTFVGTSVGSSAMKEEKRRLIRDYRT